MNNYPTWLQEDLKDRYNKIKDNIEKGNYFNKEEYILLLHNPNYESIGNRDEFRDKIKLGKHYILGRAYISGPYEGHIDWRDFIPESEKDIDNAIHDRIWFAMKKK